MPLVTSQITSRQQGFEGLLAAGGREEVLIPPPISLSIAMTKDGTSPSPQCPELGVSRAGLTCQKAESSCGHHPLAVPMDARWTSFNMCPMLSVSLL
jgi:hypothetical protein